MLEDYGRSGLSLLAFAQAQDLCYASLRRWRDLPGAARATARGPRFVPVAVAEAASDGEFTVSWPGGRSLRIPGGFDPDQLRRLLAVLEARP